MASPFHQEKEKILVDAYAVEVYIPAEYVGSEYRGTPYYAIIGNQVKYFAMGNFKVFQTQKELEDPLKVKTYVLGIPMVVLCKPTEIDTKEVRFTRNGPIRRCVVMTFYKNDEFISNTATIASSANVMMMMGRISSGKLTYIPPTIVASIVPDGEKMNGVNLRIPPEELEMYISERYRDPKHPTQKLRFATGVDPYSDQLLSYRMREEAMQTTTYQSITHEDPNNAVITSVNQRREGKVFEPTTVEIITRGLPIDKLNQENAKIAAEEEAANRTK